MNILAMAPSLPSVTYLSSSMDEVASARSNARGPHQGDFATGPIANGKRWLDNIAQASKIPGRTAMVHRIRNILARFPENEEAVRVLIREHREFEALCQEYAKTSQELEDLAKLTRPDSAIQADALRKRRVAVEEEILATIEGYNPVWRRPCSGQQVLTATTFSDELRRKEIARKRDEIRCGNPPQPHRRALQSAAARSFVHAGKWSRHEAFLNMR
jgi:hypothetical protein